MVKYIIKVVNPVKQDAFATDKPLSLEGSSEGNTASVKQPMVHAVAEGGTTSVNSVKNEGSSSLKRDVKCTSKQQSKTQKIYQPITVMNIIKSFHKKDQIGGGGSEMPFKVAAFKSSFPIVDAIATMFRSLQDDWSYFSSHPLCIHSMKKETGFPCFLCYIRNLSNRICKQKQTRTTMQPIELLSQLDQYKALVDLDFTDNSQNLKLMLEKTVELIDFYSPNFLEENKNFQMKCIKCNRLIMLGESLLLEISGSSLLNCDDISSMLENEALKSCQEHTQICNGEMRLSTKQDFFKINFKNPKAIQIPLNFKLLGENFKYRSHVCEVPQNTSIKYSTHFVQDNHQFVDNDGIIGLSANTDYGKNVKFLLFSRLESVKKQNQNIDLFPTNALKSIRNRAAWITDPDKHSSQLLKKREHTTISEKEYVASGKRKKTEAKRSATSKRKEYIEEYEKEYVASGKRKKTEAKRNQTTKRQHYVLANKKKKILENFENDTGFNCICCSCNEFKS